MNQSLKSLSVFYNHPLFHEQQALWQEAEHSFRHKTYVKHDAVLHHGDEAGSLWLVLSGWIKLVRQTPDGKESVIGLCTEGDVFGEAALFAHANYPYHAETISDQAELLSIPSDTIRRLIGKESSLSSRIMSLLHERTSQAQLKFEHMSTMTAAQRLGCFLLRLCHTQHSGNKTIHIPVEKNLLAAYLGMKPETLSRSQQQLKAVGITVSGQAITIPNIEALREFVCNSCSASGECEADSD